MLLTPLPFLLTELDGVLMVSIATLAVTLLLFFVWLLPRR